jgi:hypothetical protein
VVLTPANRLMHFTAGPSRIYTDIYTAHEKGHSCRGH